VLLGLLAALLLIVAWVYLAPSGGTAPPPSMNRAAGAGDGEAGSAAAAPRSLPGAAAANAVAGGVAGAKDSSQTVLPLRLAALDNMPHSFTAGRDPWRFVEPPPPPPPVPRQPTAAELRALQEAEAARQRLLAQQQAAAAAEAAKPKPAPFTWTYLGSFGPARLRIAVFTDGQKVWNAREGEVLEGKFVVAQIGFESVDIRFVGFPDWPAERLAVKH
jgi:hypothetical protein